MDILNVLNNLVCRDHVFSFLEVDDLLRLRRVNKTFKDKAEDFIRTKKVATKRLLKFDLGEDDPFKEFNEFRNSLRNLPTRTRADVALAYKRGKVRMLGNLRQDFMLTYGTSITHLELYGLTLPLYSQRNFQFFDPFPNLTHLRIELVYPAYKNEIPAPSSSDVNAQEIKIPASLKKLKSLRIWDMECSGSQGDKQRAFDFIAKLVETCLPTLEKLTYPYMPLTAAKVDTKKVMRLLCKCLFTAPNLKLSLDGLGVRDLLNPFERTLEMGTLDAMTKSINDKIISLEDPKNEIFYLELPNLESITFTDMDMCRMPDDFVRRDWPNLKEINVDLKDYPEGNGWSPIMPQDVWDFLFGNGIRRGNVIRVKIDFEGFQEENIEARKQNLPRTMDMTTSCLNLKILHFKNEIKQLVNLHQLWRGLGVLEDVRLESCKGLADFDFIGDDSENPVFWNLRKLKVLKLEKINGLQLTNELLSKVLCHMPIQHLTLSSDMLDSGQHSITLKGIRSLLNGQFASTIKSLHIRDLCHVSMKRTMNLERRFRSWRMA